MRAKLIRQIGGETKLDRLGGSGAGRAWRVGGLQGGASGDIDDGPAARRDHHRHDPLREPKLGKEVDRHAVFEIRVGHLEKRFVGPGTGIVDQNVDPAETVLGERGDPVEVARLGDIGDDGVDVNAGLGPDFPGRRRERRAAARRDDGAGALACQQMRHRQPDPLAATGHDGDLVGQFQVHERFLRAAF